MYIYLKASPQKSVFQGPRGPEAEEAEGRRQTS